MRALLVLSVIAFSLAGAPARAADDQPDNRDHHHCPNCEPEKKPVCLNLVCHFDMDRHSHFEHCSVASSFVKDVTLNGGEVQDVSDVRNNPQMEVTCDGVPIFNNSSHRYTELLGTRFQGQTGPDPALLIPRGELHTAPDGVGGDHYTSAILELTLESGFERTKGECVIWGGDI